ncbi:hypothetical protein [Mesorhizobium cantuariense]|uniref:Uncharacterized protein n=1 Tax=Mesorhizobium cantuariense TaxID=1300275 RepID=A0ABV7MPS5_9HYPH
MGKSGLQLLFLDFENAGDVGRWQTKAGQGLDLRPSVRMDVFDFGSYLVLPVPSQTFCQCCDGMNALRFHGLAEYVGRDVAGFACFSEPPAVWQAIIHDRCLGNALCKSVPIANHLEKRRLIQKPFLRVSSDVADEVTATRTPAATSKESYIAIPPRRRASSSYADNGFVASKWRSPSFVAVATQKARRPRIGGATGRVA